MVDCLLQILSVATTFAITGAHQHPASGNLLQAVIDHAIAANQSMVTVPLDAYVFGPTVSLKIVGATGLTIVGRGPTSLWFECGDGVHIANSTKVTFRGFLIDYHRPCFAQGRVVSAPHEVVNVTADDGIGFESSPLQSVSVAFDLVNFPGPIFAVKMADAGTLKATFWDPKTLQMVAHGNHLFTNLSFIHGNESVGVYKLTYSGPAAQGDVSEGFYATLHPRLGLANGTGTEGGLTYMITNSSMVTTADLTLHGGATESIVEGGGMGGHVYERVKVVRRPGQTPVRLLAANADGFHSSCVRIGPKLIDSEISFTGDDLLNIHSRMSIVMRPLSKTAAYIIDVEGSSSPADFDVSTLMLEQSRPGDGISFWHLGTLVANGSATVTSLRRMRSSAIEKEALDAYNAINAPPYSARISHPIGQRVWLVNWSKPLLIPKFSLVDVPRMRPHNSVVRGNYMHDSYMRAGLYDSPGMIIENNVFERTFPLYVGEHGDGWLEGPPMVANVSVSNNTFRGIFTTAANIVVNPSTTSGVQVTDNTCYDDSGGKINCD